MLITVLITSVFHQQSSEGFYLKILRQWAYLQIEFWLHPEIRIRQRDLILVIRNDTDPGERNRASNTWGQDDSKPLANSACDMHHGCWCPNYSVSFTRRVILFFYMVPPTGSKADLLFNKHLLLNVLIDWRIHLKFLLSARQCSRPWWDSSEQNKVPDIRKLHSGGRVKRRQH